MVEPLVKVLRMVDGDVFIMRYLYKSMDRAKEAIKVLFKSENAKYIPLWEIIDRRWNNTLHSPLHTFFAFFNPQLHYSGYVKMYKEVKTGLERVKKGMLFNEEDRKAFNKELILYHSKSTTLFSETALDTLSMTHSRCWWEMWGYEVPIFKKLAIKLLSQPCCASACERNWSAFDAAYTKKRNELEPKKLHNLVFIRMNLHFIICVQLKKRMIRNQSN